MEFAEFLATLAPPQWGAASLCAGWTVRDVGAHTVAYLDQSRTHLALDMVRRRWSIDRLNAHALGARAGLQPSQVVDLLRRGAQPSGAGALFGGRVALIECPVHHQDVRRPLGQLRTIPQDRLRVSLDFARTSPVLGGARRTRGVRLEATDMPWSAGRGPVVRATGEALLLAMLGRHATVADELDGSGAHVLRQQAVPFT